VHAADLFQLGFYFFYLSGVSVMKADEKRGIGASVACDGCSFDIHPKPGKYGRDIFEQPNAVIGDDLEFGFARGGAGWQLFSERTAQV